MKRRNTRIDARVLTACKLVRLIDALLWQGTISRPPEARPTVLWCGPHVRCDDGVNGPYDGHPAAHDPTPQREAAA